MIFGGELDLEWSRGHTQVCIQTFLGHNVLHKRFRAVRALVHLLGSLPVSLEGYLGFRRSALSAFRFLTDEYGFSVSETSPISVRFESEALHFELSHSPDYPMLSLRVGRREIGGDSHIGFSLDDFYYATGMGIAFEYDSYDMLDSSGIEKFLCTAALIVRTRGHLLLSGDVVAFRLLRGYADERERAFIELMERLHPAEN